MNVNTFGAGDSITRLAFKQDCFHARREAPMMPFSFCGFSTPILVFNFIFFNKARRSLARYFAIQ